MVAYHPPSRRQSHELMFFPGHDNLESALLALFWKPPKLFCSLSGFSGNGGTVLYRPFQICCRTYLLRLTCDCLQTRLSFQIWTRQSVKTRNRTWGWSPSSEWIPLSLLYSLVFLWFPLTCFDFLRFLLVLLSFVVCLFSVFFLVFPGLVLCWIP